MDKLKVAFGEILARITGVSIPLFGISWQPPETERSVVREMFIFLEDRRALYNDFAHEMEHEVADSVQEIRRELTSGLKRLPSSSEAASSFISMRAACREYLDSTQRNQRHWPGHFSFMAQLGRLRAIFGYQIVYLAAKYGIDIEGDLVRVIPPEFRDTKYLRE
jgi:hypothetical protein